MITRQPCRLRHADQDLCLKVRQMAGISVTDLIEGLRE
jgi:hypothetical protein